MRRSGTRAGAVRSIFGENGRQETTPEHSTRGRAEMMMMAGQRMIFHFMRTGVGLVCCMMLLQQSVLAQPPAPDPESKIDLREPFAELTGTETKSKLVIMLITDDDPFQWAATRELRKDGQQPRPGKAESPNVWCGANFQRAFRKMLSERPDLRDQCVVQRVAAGLPASLTGGSGNKMPRRVVVAVCDGSYRLLNFCIGLPDSQEMLHLVEDAQETQALLQLDTDRLEDQTLENQEARWLGNQIWERGQKRVRRPYRELISQIVQQDPWDDDLVSIDEAWIDRLAEKARKLEPVYLFDSQLRFGLSDAVDRLRLVVLEQHLEARANWCECVLPFVAGRSMEEILSPLVDVIWNVPPIIDINPEQHAELLDWMDIRHKNSMIVLAIQPHLQLREIQWPPPNVSGRIVVNNSWQDLEAKMAEHSFREINLEQLAVILSKYDEGPLNALVPSRVRYVVFPADKRPFVIRESDLPVKFMSRLKGKKTAK